jgi:nucleotide-binding universal stress UspA family protein
MIANDGSDGAAYAIAAAGRLFAGAVAKVVVIPDPTPAGVPAESLARITTAVERHAQGVAQAGAEAAAAAGLDAEGIVATPRAPAWEGLLEAADGSDVIVCGSRGQSGLARAMLGSTSMSLLHHTPLPLLIVPDAAPGDGPAVLTYDGSDVAGHAIGVAGPLLGARPAVVVHVWESPYKHSLSGRALSGVAELEGIVDELEGRLADGAREVTESGVGLARFAGLDARGETMDSGEGVWRAVVPFAAKLDAAAIVTGARGHGGARSALLGSTSSGLAHHAGRPVLVVPSS